MNEPAQGSVILVDFTYSNQVQSKVRPALVMSNSRYTTISRDVIVMKITSRKPKMMAVSLTNEDLQAGSLDYPSYVQVDGIYAMEKRAHHRHNRYRAVRKDAGDPESGFRSVLCC